MRLIEKDCVPDTNQKTEYELLIEAFIESGMNCAEIVDMKKDVQCIRGSLAYHLKKKKLGNVVVLKQSNKKLYLQRVKGVKD